MLTRDGRRILAWSDDVRLWDLETGQQIGETMKHKAPVRGAAMSKDGRTYLSWARDDTLRLWDAATAHRSEPVMHHGEAPLEIGRARHRGSGVQRRRPAHPIVVIAGQQRAPVGGGDRDGRSVRHEA